MCMIVGRHCAYLAVDHATGLSLDWEELVAQGLDGLVEGVIHKIGPSPMKR